MALKSAIAHWVNENLLDEGFRDTAIMGVAVCAVLDEQFSKLRRAEISAACSEIIAWRKAEIERLEAIRQFAEADESFLVP